MRGRKPKSDPPVGVKIRLPTTIHNRLSQYLEDPLTGRPIHGARSVLVTNLIKEYLDKKEKNIPNDLHMTMLLKQNKLQQGTDDYKEPNKFISELLTRLGYKSTVDILQHLHSEDGWS